MDSKMIGERIASARKKMNLSQAQLGQHVFVSPQAVGKWERGESIPDIITLNRVADFLVVDLNYFSGRTEASSSVQSEDLGGISHPLPAQDEPVEGIGWNMSFGNWVDGDFSGLSNLHEKFNGSNLQRCKFVGSELSGLLLKGNHVDHCDFSNSNISHSQFRGCNLASNSFADCSLKETEFWNSVLKSCDLSGSDLSGTLFKACDFRKNTLNGAKLSQTIFKETHLTDIVFEGDLDKCQFENCGFTRVTFQQCRISRTFLKGVRLKSVVFVDCEADNISYSFLKSGKADMSGIRLVEGF